jgi:hypothetical protein
MTELNMVMPGIERSVSSLLRGRGSEDAAGAHRGITMTRLGSIIVSWS